MGVHNTWTVDTTEAELAKQGLDSGPPPGRDREQVTEPTETAKWGQCGQGAVSEDKGKSWGHRAVSGDPEAGGHGAVSGHPGAGGVWREWPRGQVCCARSTRGLSPASHSARGGVCGRV